MEEREKMIRESILVRWAFSKTWLHRERRSKEPVKMVKCRTMEELERELASWAEEVVAE